MSRHSTRKSFDLDWVEQWARRVNEDRILPVIGRFFTGRFVLGVDDTDYLIEVSKGKIQRIAEGLTSNDFGLILRFELQATAGRNFHSPFRLRRSTTSGPWRIPCTTICASRATHFRSGRTCGHSPACSL